MRITPTSLTINQLFSNQSEQFVIPAYQRKYSWRERQITELLDDIYLIDGNDTHLLGSIVCLTAPHSALGNLLELVDGQQRLTTVYIILECIRQRMLTDGNADKVSKLADLLSFQIYDGKPQEKLLLETIDASEFRRLAEASCEANINEYKNKHLYEAFRIVRDWIGNSTLEEVGALQYKLLNHSLIIRLDVSEAKDAFKLFETINNRGLKLSPTDIIKNFVLGNAARFSEASLDNARKSWAEIIGYLDGTDTDSFFRYFLISILHKRITTAQIVLEFKKSFMKDVMEAVALPDRHLYADDEELYEGDEEVEVEDELIVLTGGGHISFKDFLMRIVKSAKVYGELIHGRTGKALIDRHLRNLRMIKAVQTYGFLMHLRVSDVNDRTFIKVLKLTENFVLRRHICRERANETEALFARMCAIDAANPINEVKKLYREASPSDEKFREEFAIANFTPNIIERARYCLEQFEIKNHGDYNEIHVLGAEDVHVEHIIPQKIKTRRSREEFGDWQTYLGARVDTEHPKFVSRIGNLTLFSGTLNIIASNNPFFEKKKSYKNSAIFMTRSLANMSTFKFRQVNERSSDFAEQAVLMWPIA